MPTASDRRRPTLRMVLSATTVTLAALLPLAEELVRRGGAGTGSALS
jgi:hypothetical protein